VGEEVSEAGLGDGEAVGLLEGLSACNFVWCAFVLALHVGIHIVVGLLDIAGHVEGVSRSLGDSETVVKSDASGNGTEAWEFVSWVRSREQWVTYQ